MRCGSHSAVAEKAPPPPAHAALDSMLSKGVLGLPDQGAHLELEQETRGVERRLAARAPLRGRR